MSLTPRPLRRTHCWVSHEFSSEPSIAYPLTVNGEPTYDIALKYDRKSPRQLRVWTALAPGDYLVEGYANGQPMSFELTIRPEYFDSP